MFLTLHLNRPTKFITQLHTCSNQHSQICLHQHLNGKLLTENINTQEQKKQLDGQSHIAARKATVRQTTQILKPLLIPTEQCVFITSDILHLRNCSTKLPVPKGEQRHRPLRPSWPQQTIRVW